MTPESQPVKLPFWTPGMVVALVFMTGGAVAVIARYVGGLGCVTNLSDSHPWGMWVGVDVAAGVALAAGGFTTAFLAHILGRHHYEEITRPALITAALGYTFVALSLVVDIGRSWAIWKPLFFQNHHSVLFEVAMCVVIYLTVLWIEFIPIAAERFGARVPVLAFFDRILGKTIWVFIILGVVLSCMHQSSLGTLMTICPTKMSPLWYSPLLPLLFLLSAMAVGYPMVVVETTIVAKSLKRGSEMKILTPLSQITLLLLGIYMVFKVGDLVYRGAHTTLLDGSGKSLSFIVEVGLGVIVPWLMLVFSSVRHSQRFLFIASMMIVLGVLLNRINVFIVAFESPFTDASYYPAVGEVLITCGAVASIFLLYRAFITFFPVLSAHNQEA